MKLKLGIRGTYKDNCPVCHRPKSPHYCQCPEEPKKKLTDKWIDKNICSIKGDPQ